jgi:hypothetical protein
MQAGSGLLSREGTLCGRTGVRNVPRLIYAHTSDFHCNSRRDQFAQHHWHPRTTRDTGFWSVRETQSHLRHDASRNDSGNQVHNEGGHSERQH